MESRFNEKDQILTAMTYPNAPCHTCIYQDGEAIGLYGKGAIVSCKKYPVPKYSIGVKGKPDGILKGTKRCGFYKKIS